MDTSFFAYLQKLQLLVFFSGYPLVYSLAKFFFLRISRGSPAGPAWWLQALPMAYALIGSLFAGLLLKQYTGGPVNILYDSLPVNLLTGWGLLATLFWLPVLRKKPPYSLLHSLPFFLILLFDFFSGQGPGGYSDSLRNDMRMYSLSLAIGSLCLLQVLVIRLLGRRFSSGKQR